MFAETDCSDSIYKPPFLHSNLTVPTMTVGASVPFHPYRDGNILAYESKGTYIGVKVGFKEGIDVNCKLIMMACIGVMGFTESMEK